MNEKSVGSVPAHLSINVCLCVELKLPEIKLSYSLLITIWRNNRSSGSD